MRPRALAAAVAGLLALCLCSTGYAADEGDAASWLPVIHGEFRTYFIYQNDTDFDRTEPLYNEYGQEMGYFSTTFNPNIRWVPHEAVELYYELEIGDNIWSRNDANQGDATGEGRTIFRHKEFWGKVGLPGIGLSLSAGYQHVVDPTALIVDRRLGSAFLAYGWGGGRAMLGAAQVPDTIYEGRDPNQAQFDPDYDGFDTDRNNFNNDEFVFFARADQSLPIGLIIRPGVYFTWDRTIVDRELRLASPVVGLEWHATDILCIELDLAGQFGTFENGGIDNRDVEISAGAAQLALAADWRAVSLRFSSLAFTADDGDPYNLTDHGFAYSGKSRSATVLLSENWLQDNYNNLDERAAMQKAGLLLADLQITGRPLEWIEIFAIGGYGMVLEDKHLNADPLLGWEIDAGMRVNLYREMVRLTLLQSTLLPGKAAAALSNEIDTEATDSIWNLQAAFEIRF